MLNSRQAPTRDGVRVEAGPTALVGSGAKATNNHRHMAIDMAVLPASPRGMERAISSFQYHSTYDAADKTVCSLSNFIIVVYLHI
jgi:hypothetical protein